MTNGEHVDDEVSRTLGLLNRIGPVRAPLSLTAGVMERLEGNARPRPQAMPPAVRVALAGLIALAALNVVTLLGTGARAGTVTSAWSAAVDSLAREYGLTAQVSQDLE